MDRAAYIHQISSAQAGWIKFDHNPVLGGNLGTCFDCSILKEHGLYRMIFSWRPKKSIALSESVDGIQWSDLIILMSPRPSGQGWEDDLNRPAVVKKDGLYHMWYTGQNPGKLPRSADGRSWIFYATSIDCVHWQRAGLEPVLAAEEAWEKAAVMNPHVIWDEQAGLFKMWYSAGEQYEPNAIGYAASPDGIQWTKHPANPILAPSENGWDGDACYKPFALFDGQDWRLWYNGRHGGLEQIGMAVHQGQDLGFD